jgi:hypothetical protein
MKVRCSDGVLSGQFVAVTEPFKIGDIQRVRGEGDDGRVAADFGYI